MKGAVRAVLWLALVSLVGLVILAIVRSWNERFFLIWLCVILLLGLRR